MLAPWSWKPCVQNSAKYHILDNGTKHLRKDHSQASVGKNWKASFAGTSFLPCVPLFDQGNTLITLLVRPSDLRSLGSEWNGRWWWRWWARRRLPNKSPKEYLLTVTFEGRNNSRKNKCGCSFRRTVAGLWIFCRSENLSRQLYLLWIFFCRWKSADPVAGTVVVDLFADESHFCIIGTIKCTLWKVICSQH